MINNLKIIYDSIHKSIGIPKHILPVISEKVFQRLTGVKQLGLTYLVFPGAMHTRFEHSIGTYHLSTRVSQEINISEHDALTLQYSSLLHDSGHGPFSHTFDMILKNFYKTNHVEISSKIILGDILYKGENNIPYTMEKNDVSPKEVVNILKGENLKEEKKYLHEIIDGEADIDQIDYLLRDSYHTGVALGSIDHERLIKSFEIFNGHLVVGKKGINAAEGLTVGRNLMYSSVYFHKTVRIAEVMLERAIELKLLSLNNLEDIYLYDDAELIQWLMQSEGISRELAERIRFRKLYKKVVIIEELENLHKILPFFSEMYKQVNKKIEFENELSLKWTGKPYKVFIDIPEIETDSLKSDKIKGIKIVKDNQLLLLKNISPICEAISKKSLVPYKIMVICEEKYKENVKKEFDKLLTNIG
jgi:HD superfamily phosphohydrolase